MSQDSSPASESQRSFTADDALPPVEPPSTAFLFQLFLIPLMIVSAIVLVWMLLSWVAQGQADPTELIRELRQPKDTSWQRAVTLANMLSSREPRYESLRNNEELGRELASILAEELEEPIKGRDKPDQARYQKRIYISRALGEMKVPAGLSVLLDAAETERTEPEVDTRLAALDALALLASNWGPEKMREDERAVKVLLECSRTQVDDPTTGADGKPTDYRPHSEIRAVAAYALGVMGGEQATERLKIMLEDGYPSARFNAATGLARGGDPAAIPVLLEMLDPGNESASKDERDRSERENRRVLVMRTGMSVALKLAEKNPQAEIAPLVKAVEKLTTDELKSIENPAAKNRLRMQATETFNRLKKPAGE